MEKVILLRKLGAAIAVLGLSSSAWGAITGTVFQDFNSNGIRDTATTIANQGTAAGTIGVAVDKGLAGVQVRAFCVTNLGADGVLGTADDTITTFGPVTTSATGAYSITTTGVVAATAPKNACRVEFSWDATSQLSGVLQNPLFGMRPTFVGTGSNTSTQFVNDGATANLGLNYPGDFCQNNPTLVTNCATFGAYNDATFGTRNAINSLPYNGRSDATVTTTPLPAQLARVNQVGSTWGLAYHKPADKVLAASYFRRHIGNGPGGLGQIYAVNSSGSVVSNFLNLEVLKPGSAGVNPRVTPAPAAGISPADPAGYDYDLDANVLVGGDLKVGKLGIGDIDISDDQRTLYAIGLNSRKLYIIPVGVGLTAPATGAAITEVSLPNPGTVSGTGCPNDPATPAGELNLNLRPFAVKANRGFVYVGMTCTGESTGADADLRAFVYRYDGAAFTQVANTTLNYSLQNGSGPLKWNKWSDLADSGSSGCCFERPEPLLTDIEFSASGDMLLGIRDRTGDTTSRGALALTGGGRVDGRAHGDLVRACLNAATGVYSAASCTPVGQQWFTDTFPDPNNSMGGLAQVPGFPDVVQTVKDPAQFYTGGLGWFNTTTGTSTKPYEVVVVGPQNAAGVFVSGGKAAGMGDIEALCGTAPLEVGNRVWLDANGNGVQDPGEAPIAGVTVRLYAPNGTTVLATAVTDANGQYAFSNRTADENGVAIAFPGATTSTTGTVNAIPGFNPDTTGYSIRFDNAADYAAGGPLATLGLAPANAGGVTTNDPLLDLTDSDATLPTPASPIGTGNYPRINFDTGGAGENNFGLDVGFVESFSLGNRIWYDTNNNGVLDTGEAPIPGVLVDLLNGTGQKLYRTPGGAIVTTATGNTAIEATTDANGYYRFDSLPAGTYAARVTAANWTPATGVLAGYANSSFTGTGATTGAGDPNGATAVNNTDKGIDNPTPATGGITSRTVTLGTGLQPTGEDAGATGAGAAGPTGDASDNRTVDFGFYRLTVGNLIWRDDGTGGGAANNGTRDGTEPGIDGVRVELLDSTNTVVAVTTTAGGGLYNFTQKTDATGAPNGNPLTPGNYTVRVPGGQTPLSGFTSSADPAGGATPLSADNDDNGTGTSATTGATTTSAFALAAGTNAATGAIGTNATGATDQPRVDLGFVPAPTNFSIGNRVFSDPNNNGRQDAGETGIANVQVRLLDSAGVAVPGVPAQTTDANGYYRFDNLPAGNYIVEVVGSTLPAGSVSSTGTQTGDQGDKGADTPVAGNYRSAVVAIGTGLQPTGETDLSGTGQGAQGPGGDANTNSTIDFGFVPPTYSIGNRVWRDANNDGLRAATGEPGIDGVAMTLYRADAAGNPTGGPIATTTTAAGGYYRFDSLQAGDYVVIVDAANFATGAPLKTLASSTTTQANANSDTDNDDNGIDAINPAASGIRSGRITVGPGASEPVGETDLVAGANPQGPSPDDQANMTVDFGFYPLASLGDRVFLDTNANGIQDAGEGGVPGVTVKLLDGAGNPVIDPVTGLPRTTTTDGNGNYLFTNLPVGSYQVEFVPPAGYSISPKDQGGNDATDSDVDPTTRRTPVVTLAPGENNLTLDAGLFFTAALGDRVWHDLNKNGTQDAGEPGVPGVTVTLFNSTTGATVATTTTDGSGNYNFTGLTPGVPYVVQFSNLPAGYQFTAKGPGASTSDPADSDADTTTGRTDPITLVSGQNDPNWDAGIFGPIDLTLGKAVAPVAPGSGSPYLTGDQVEYTLTIANGGPATALAGYTVTDLLPAGLTSPTIVSSTGFTPCAFAGSTLSCTGSANLPAGASNALTIKYRATIGAAAGTIKNIAYVDKAASDPSVETNPLGTPPTAATNASASPTNNDADTSIVVNATTYSLGNRVWVDTNNNGTIDAGELGRDGVKVELIDSTGTVIATTTTANGGYYRFDNLPAGDYVVQIAASNFATAGPLQGYTSSGPTETNPNSDVDSNDNGLNTPVGGAIRSGTVTLGPATSEPTGETDVASPNPAGEAPDGRSNLTVDFGFVPPASLGNFVFNDTNGNGVQDAGEVGVPGVTVTLLDAAGNAVPGVPPQITGADGSYLFTNLPPGTYAVGFTTLPPGTTFTTADQGGNDATDSDVNPATGTTGLVTLAPGETNLTVDAGIRTQAGVTVGNFVWRDNNGNGIQDAGEPGVQGVTATISRVGGGTVTDITGNPVTTTVLTDVNGLYQFSNLAAGQYTITFSTLPAGFTPTTTNAPGSTTANDSNGLTATSTVLTPGQSDLTLDLGLIPPATPTFSIGNRVFSDPNNNGRQDAGESGISGVQVRLLDSTGAPVAGVATQTTDASGYYRFDNLQAGTYIVEVIGTSLPAGVSSSTGTQTGDQGDKGNDTPVAGNYRSGPVQLGTGLQPTGETDLTASGPGAQGPSGDANTNSTIDFGFVPAVAGTATINGNVFGDTNRDGTKGPAEGGVPAGTTVNLVNPATGAIVATTTTDANGNYTFPNVPPGNYNVVVPTPPAGTSATTATTVPVTATAGNTTTAPNIGFGPATGTASITGTVFSDPNRDGTKGPAEGGVPPGTTVLLVDPVTGVTVATTTTGANGNYTFPNVPPGNYNIVVPTPPGTSPTTATTIPVTATVGAASVAPNIGFGPANGTGTITGTVFTDPNRDGTKAPAEGGVPPGTTVQLLGPTGTVIATTTTDANGNYSFINVPPGQYTVLVPTAPAGTSPTTPTSVPVTSVANAATTAANIGFGPGAGTTASVTGNVFVDPNRSGTRDPSELGAPAITVSLVNAAGTVVIATTTTDANGNYTFPNVPAGNYNIFVSVPVTVTATTPFVLPITVPASGVVTPPPVGLGQPLDGAVPIPTLSEWALILLAMMLAAIGVQQQRKRV
jgi:protocatechuate 3,4-dioxygenase beta subunit